MKLSGIKSAESCHDDSIWAAAWVPPSTSRPTSLLLTGSLDESVRLWHSDDLSSAAPPSRGHSLGVVSLSAHPSGSIAAATSLDSLVRVFDVDTAASIALLEAAPSEAWGLQFNPKVLSFFLSLNPTVQLFYQYQYQTLMQLFSLILPRAHS